jgi:hypothetical protein
MTRLVSMVIVAAALAACAQARPTPTTVTAADVPAEPMKVATQEAAPAAKDPAPPSDAPVCRTKRPGGGVTELVLEWKGEEAKGFLRTTAASGNVTTQRVQAMRHKGMIVADDLNSTDLVDHAALVRNQDGKTYILLADHEQIWSLCE